MDFKGKAKWDAWNGKKGMSQDDAKQKYIDLANTLKEKHGVSSQDDAKQKYIDL